jgi:hypothetical protein
MLGASNLRLHHCLLLGICLASVSVAEAADELPIVRGVEPQPLKAQVARVVQALDLLGNPLPADQKAALEKALKAPDSADSVEQVQAALDPLCLVGVDINPESRVKVVQGPAPRKLVEQGWRVFLVKVHNEAGVTAPLRVSSPNSEAVYKRSSGKHNADAAISKQEVENSCQEVSLYDKKPLNKELTGLAL